ncbi:MAG: CRP/FNR family cyclic AMP-dependent transcriptional regulator [Sulfurimonas sp.]|jgi:CRP/FNR family cyclic AMP-dependent transcriptional regulator
MLLTIERVIILKSINIFSKISENDLLLVATKLTEVEYAKDSTIIKQGELGTSMYILVRGKVDVIVDGKTLTSLGKGSIFGELAALDPEPRSATIKTIEDSLVFKISSTVIYNLIGEYPNVARGIIEILCARIRENN